MTQWLLWSRNVDSSGKSTLQDRRCQTNKKWRIGRYAYCLSHLFVSTLTSTLLQARIRCSYGVYNICITWLTERHKHAVNLENLFSAIASTLCSLQWHILLCAGGISLVTHETSTFFFILYSCCNIFIYYHFGDWY